MWIYAFLPVYLHVHLQESRLWVVSLALTAPAATRWLMAPVWGRAADRSRSPHSQLVVGLLGYACLLLGLGTLRRPIALITLVAGASAFGSAFNPVARALVSVHDRSRSMLNLAAWHQWEAAGYLLSGLVIGTALEKPTVFAWLTSGTALVLSLCAVWIGFRGGAHDPRTAQDPGPMSDRRHIRATNGPTSGHSRLTILGVDPLLRQALLFLFAASFLWEAVAGTFGLYFTQIVRGSLVTYGFTISLSTGLSLLIYKPLARYGQYTSTARLFALGGLSATVMYALMSMQAPWAATAGYMVPFTSILRTAFNSLLVGNVAVNRRGEFLGIMEATESAAAVLGPLAGGIGADRFGLAAIPLFAFWASFALHLVGTQRGIRRIV